MITVGRLDRQTFELMSIKLVIIIEKSQPMKLKIVGTIKGGVHDGEDAGVAEFIVPTYIHRGTLGQMSAPAAKDKQFSSDVLNELDAVKTAAMGDITGNINRLVFDYTAPNVTDNMETFKIDSENGAEASSDQALAKQFFTALWHWSGGQVSMLFLDEANASQLVGEVLGELVKQCNK